MLSNRLLFCAALGLIASVTNRAADAAGGLKDVYRDAFLVGVAIGDGEASDKAPRSTELIEHEFNSVTPENALKWDTTEPSEGRFNFAPGDRFVAYAERHHLTAIGHTLCWHSQLPGWVSRPPAGQTELTREVLLQRLHRHIQEVAGHYKGRIHGWDVVNEAIRDGDGQYRDSVFYRVVGKEFIALAFKWAHEADPAAELYYNDYNLDQDDKKRATAIELVKYLREQGAPISGIGLQGHYNLTYPRLSKIDETIQMFADLGLKVDITELDVMAVTGAEISGAVDAGRSGPAKRGGVDRRLIWGHSKPPQPLSAELQQAQARRYGDIFKIFFKHRDVIDRVTVWGLRDADSWRRYSSPLLFDDEYRPKPAYESVVAAAK